MKDEINNEYINRLEVLLRCAKKDIEQLISLANNAYNGELDAVVEAKDTIEQINELLD